RLLEPVGEMIGDFLEGESYEAVEHQRLFMIRQGIPASFLPDRVDDEHICLRPTRRKRVR
ncbi:hypothetical protein, partial [Nonomuraea basaltis]|uniref:hypothetical protein n=1 Tax=Nonomuraea basaltis TaxID=2495887 RepID=UPI00197F24BA